MGHVVPFRLGLSLYIPCTVQVNDKFLFMTSRVCLVLRLVPSAHLKVYHLMMTNWCDRLDGSE